jgi:hypothetical protein
MKPCIIDPDDTYTLRFREYRVRDLMAAEAVCVFFHFGSSDLPCLFQDLTGIELRAVDPYKAGCCPALDALVYVREPHGPSHSIPFSSQCPRVVELAQEGLVQSGPYSLTVEQLDAILKDRVKYNRCSVHLI